MRTYVRNPAPASPMNMSTVRRLIRVGEHMARTETRTRGRSVSGTLFADPEVSTASHFSPDARVVLYNGDTLDLLRTLPTGLAGLVVTSPPYNIGKPYERRVDLDVYLEQQRQVIEESVRVLSPKGSICWQVGNFVQRNEIVPLDIALYPIFKQAGLKLRNRIVWHFEHGLHCSRRLSGRHETILWFTKTDDYVFNVDPIRVPQKYPFKKAFKGPRLGQYTSNPLGKNPGDVWIIPNVKHNHVEKTEHPCQFPVELVDRLVLALTDPGDWVVDPFIGVGTTAVSAIRHGRRCVGADIVPRYLEIARERVALAAQGLLRVRPMDRPIYDPAGDGQRATDVSSPKRPR
jgi:adenine-specific DNA-methyltransferase